jgi:hypothetical protein
MVIPAKAVINPLLPSMSLVGGLRSMGRCIVPASLINDDMVENALRPIVCKFVVAVQWLTLNYVVAIYHE